ncbi:MAG: adenosylmethionine--8-amino-7-oxononanoate transaminase [Bacteriovorax sp.]|nr:adenosylmethionine--8-amino-7-oxononanoate transaminase [Bacteriovorax sp.]
MHRLMRIWRPYTQMQTALPPLPVKDAEGAYINLKCGRKIFDGISSWWLINHGHANQEITEAISSQAKKIEQVVFANFTHEPAEELIELLGTFLPKSLSSVFFSDNGSTAVEVAMKMAYQYQVQSGRSNREKFITFEKAYHGDTCGAMSVSAHSVFTNPYGKMRFEVLHAKQGCYLSDPIDNWVNDFEKIIQTHSDEICAVILEPLIQGAGGMVMWPVKAIEIISQRAKENNILVIFDEVMTGFGRTGSMFAFEQTLVIPDFLCLSKGLTGGFLPMGLTITTEQIFDAFLNDSAEKMFFHGHSFTGNALSCAASVANLKLFQKMNIKKIIQPIEEAHKAFLEKCSRRLAIKEVRVCGSIGVLELNMDYQYGNNFSQKMHQLAINENLFVRPLGNVIYLMPPFCSTSQEIERSWEIIENSILELII